MMMELETSQKVVAFYYEIASLRYLALGLQF